MLTYLLSLARWLVVFLLVAVPLLVIFRDRIPAWSRRIGSSFARFWRKGDEVSRSPARSKSSA
jgi:Sec-independent protein translocase protein TatA